MPGLPINRKNVVANDFDDPEIEQEENVRDFIAELKEKLEEKASGPKMTGAQTKKEKEKMEKMLRQQRIREAVRSGSRRNRWEEEDRIEKLREKFKNRK
ncbi:hypothetical protein C0580_02465 [Candidatus Parcubacteria bacterium]|nr:MAG: hypothetical protein C0580_02465 [Candidatus Parcubacteria bacterium]